MVQKKDERNLANKELESRDGMAPERANRIEVSDFCGLYGGYCKIN
jgi:hypothetical protein